MKNKLYNLKSFFKTGNTLPYEFRIKQIEKLKLSLEKYEEDILRTLKIDLSKPKFESFTSELGLIYEEINKVLSELATWMESEKVPTPLYLKPANSYIKPNPKGVVLIISPWNYPYLLSFSPLIGAIAAGNCALVKLSNKAHYSNRLIKTIINETFENNYVDFLELSGEDLGRELEKNPQLDHIFFTGSSKVGKKIASIAASNLIPYSLELGGKSPAIVDSSTNLNQAAKKIIWAKLFNAGQTCIAPDYLIIEESVKDKFIDMCVLNINKFYGSDIYKSKDYARIIDLDSFHRITSLINKDKVIFGGEYQEEDLYISPTILDANLEDPIMKEEIFGPLLPILTFTDEYQIRDIIEKNPNPLSLYLFTELDSMKEIILNGVQFGGGCINDTMSQMANLNLPFGGFKNSGHGSYHSYYSFKEFSHFKSILESKTNLDVDIRYPPYSNTKMKMSKFFLK